MGKARSKQTAHFLAPESPPGLEKGTSCPCSAFTVLHGPSSGGMVNLHQKGHSGPSEMARSCALEGWGESRRKSSPWARAEVSVWVFRSTKPERLGDDRQGQAHFGSVIPSGIQDRSTSCHHGLPPARCKEKTSREVRIKTWTQCSFVLFCPRLASSFLM